MHQKLSLSGRRRPALDLRVAAVSLLLAALILGGATREGYFATAAVRLISLAVLLLVAWRWRTAFTTAAKWPLVLLVCVLAVPVLQLIPLPPAVWTALPNREGFADAYRAGGMALPWLPLSLSPDATWNAGLSLIPAAAMFLVVTQLDPRGRRDLIPWLLVFVLVSIVLGIAQIAGGPESELRPYATTNASAAVGFFANRNHQASLLAAALPLGVVWFLARTRSRGPRTLVMGAAVLLAIAVGAAVSGSRAGLILLVPAALGALALAMRAGELQGIRSRMVVGGLLIACLVPAAVFATAEILDDFSGAAEKGSRLATAPVIARGAAAYFPAGSGLGAFEDVYRMLETPETLTNAFLNHAHNDYLELWLETGVLGLVVLALFVLWFGWTALRFWRAERPWGLETLLGAGASLTILLLMAHSAVDYPLRTTALSVLFAYACGCMTPSPPRAASVRQAAQ